MKTRMPLVPAFLVVIATLLGALVVVRVAFALDSDAARFEAETMSENSDRISVVNDNGIQVLSFVNTDASASKSVSFSANAQMTKIRVRGVDDSGTTRTLPRVRVTVDGAQVLSQQVSGSYSTLTAPISVDAGTHTVSVNMTNRDTGDRIFVDWIAFTYSEPTPPPSQCPEGKYLATYRNESAAQAFTTQPVLTRCESAPLDYGWGTSSPAPGVNADDFTVLWKGNFDFEGGDYTFSARSDDGIRVYVDGARVIDAFFDQSATDRQSTRTLTAGTHEVKVEYYESGGDAVAELSWVKVASEPPPPSQCSEGKYLATYRNESAAQAFTTQPVLTRCESAPLDYGWGTSSPAPGVNADDFTVLWKGNFDFEGGDYTFSARSDDGIRVYVDGARVIDAFFDQSATDRQSTRTLTAGTHEVKVEYYESGGDAVAELSWVKVASEPPTSKACTTFSSPITITSGGTYSGCWRSTSFNTPAVTVSTTQPVVIENSGIKATGYKIRHGVQGVNLTVRDSYFYGENPNIAGQPTEYAVYLLQPQNLVVENNHFVSTPGIKVQGMYAPRTGTVKVRYNTASNIDARLSNGSGGYQVGQHALRQFFQSDHMIGVPGVEIAWNQVINQPGQSAVEDNINFYLSKGTSFSPIHAHNNYIDGAFPNITASTTSYPRYSGSGIVCADGNPASASEVTAYIRCANNQVLDSLNVGIATPHGHHIELANNRVVGDHDGVQLQSWAPVGMHCQNLSNAPSTHFYSNSIHDNAVAAIGNGTGRNDYWLDGDCVASNNASLPTVGEAAEWSLWQSKLSSGGVVLGPRG